MPPRANMEKPELILLGLPKTGTTWLAATLDHIPEIEIFDESEKIEQLWARPQGLPVIIAETVTDPLFLPSLDHRDSALASMGERLPCRHHLLFLREPGDWVRSLYRQYIRRGGYRPFQAFFSWDENAVLNPGFLNYHRVVREARDRLHGSLVIADYGHLQTDPRGVIYGISKAFGPSSNLAGLEQFLVPDSAYTRHANVGLRGRSGRWLRAFNRVRRSRWNPRGLFSWKRAERLPWHLLGTSGEDLLSAEDETYLGDLVAQHSDWAHWQKAFDKHWLLTADEAI